MPPAPVRTHRAALARLLRYGSVSALSTATSLTVLGLLVGVFGVAAIVANIIATAVGTVPSFELNRRWVWSQGASRSFRRQILPYCTLSFLGLIISSLAVHFASNATSHSSRAVHTIAVECGNFGAYGALWLFQFVLCDRVLFRSSTARLPSNDPVLSPSGGGVDHRRAEPLSRQP
jgi:putative flippase GtrA